MCKSAARALIDAIGRLSLTVMSVRLLPASDIVRSALSSSSDHRSYCLRVNIVVASRPVRQGQVSECQTQLAVSDHGRWMSVEVQVLALRILGRYFQAAAFQSNYENVIAPKLTSSLVSKCSELAYLRQQLNRSIGTIHVIVLRSGIENVAFVSRRRTMMCNNIGLASRVAASASRGLFLQQLCAMRGSCLGPRALLQCQSPCRI
jgi:hypothetical protein